MVEAEKIKELQERLAKTMEELAKVKVKAVVVLVAGEEEADVGTEAAGGDVLVMTVGADEMSDVVGAVDEVVAEGSRSKRLREDDEEAEVEGGDHRRRKSEGKIDMAGYDQVRRGVRRANAIRAVSGCGRGRRARVEEVQAEGERYGAG